MAEEAVDPRVPEGYWAEVEAWLLPQYQGLPRPDSAVSLGTRSHRPELIQGIP